jgi:hypothetical protein
VAGGDLFGGDEVPKRVTDGFAAMGEGCGDHTAKCGLTANAGSRRTVRRTTEDQTRGGGWNAPGPTSKSDSAFTQGASITVRRP